MLRRLAVNRKLLWPAALLGLLGIGGTTALRMSPSAVADDSLRTTVLERISYDFDGDGPESAEPAIRMRIDSLEPLDEKTVIRGFLRLPSQLEKAWAGTRGEWSTDPSNWCEYVAADQLPSGSEVRVVYTTKDIGGNTTFSYQRTLTIP